ncbi:unnamed protein product, partial [Symbiodinium necroappetens]
QTATDASAPSSLLGRPAPISPDPSEPLQGQKGFGTFMRLSILRVLASDGSAREPAASVVLGQFSETSLLTQAGRQAATDCGVRTSSGITSIWRISCRSGHLCIISAVVSTLAAQCEPLPVSSHVRLHDDTGQSLGAATVLSCDKGFLLLKKEENGPEPGVHFLKVRRKGPKTVFSDVVSLDYAERFSAQVMLERALRTPFPRLVARRADGEVWEDREGGPLPALGAVGDSSHLGGIKYGQMLTWPKGAFPCRAILKTDEDEAAPDDRKVEDVQVRRSFR